MGEVITGKFRDETHPARHDNKKLFIILTTFDN